jgi:hypothetical protein
MGASAGNHGLVRGRTQAGVGSAMPIKRSGKGSPAAK